MFSKVGSPQVGNIQKIHNSIKITIAIIRIKNLEEPKSKAITNRLQQRTINQKTANHDASSVPAKGVRIDKINEVNNSG